MSEHIELPHQHGKDEEKIKQFVRKVKNYE